jgi:TonB family protein
MEAQLFTLLPPPAPRWKSLLIGWGVQSLSLACLLFAGVQVHQNLTSDKDYRITRLVTYEPAALPEPTPVAPRVIARSKPPIESKAAPKVDPPIETKPVLQALIVTPQARAIPVHKVPEPDFKAPELKLESKAPVIPAAPAPQIVATGTFSEKTPLMASAKPGPAVQTGGFGDVNGVPASDHRGLANINEKGSPDSPYGSGHGNAMFGSNSGVVTRSGFGNLVATGAAKAPGTAKLSSGANAPVEITYKPKPDYTEEGRKQKINGEVRLQVLFSADGRVRVMRVLQGLGYGLDEQAVKAAEQIKFKPALREGQPTDSTALVHIIFELIS